jgi:hypothetical protein
MSASYRRRQPSTAQSSGLMRREARSLLGTGKGKHARGGTNSSYGTFLLGTVGNVLLRLLGVSLAFEHLTGWGWGSSGGGGGSGGGGSSPGGGTNGDGSNGGRGGGGAQPGPFVFLALAAASVPLVLGQFPLKLRNVRWGHVASKGVLRFASLTLWCQALAGLYKLHPVDPDP